ncbi:MAG: VTT domain-containing protein [Pseudomonadota bacterium]
MATELSAWIGKIADWVDLGVWTDLMSASPELAPVFAIGMMVIISVLPLVPAETGAVINGVVFGPLIGSALTWAGALLSALLAFLLARAISPWLMRKFPDSRVMGRMQCMLNTRGTVALISLRLVPLVPFTMVNLTAGALGVRGSTFLWTTALGLIPAAVLFTTVGDLAVTGSGSGWIAAFGLFAMIMVGRHLRRSYRECA